MTFLEIKVGGALTTLRRWLCPFASLTFAAPYSPVYSGVFMAHTEKKLDAVVDASSASQGPDGETVDLRHTDDELLAELGYKSEFKREFSVSISLL